MKLLLPETIAMKLKTALEKAGTREIGGILMGEYVSDSLFRICDLTVQKQPGSFASFRRLFEGFASSLQIFFRKTNYDFTRFNYLGEWHSHPCFDLAPSNIDSQTMWEIVEDPDVGANFVVLLIVKLNKAGKLEASSTIYFPNKRTLEAYLIHEKYQND